MNDKPSWQATVVALGFLGLVGVMFWRAVDTDFATVWAGVGTIVGVVTGAIPAFFFHSQAKSALATADKAARRAEAYAAIAPAAAAQRVQNNPAFQ